MIKFYNFLSYTIKLLLCIASAFFLISVSFIQRNYAQSYGLGFSGHEVVQDKRTSLDLSPGESFCFDRSFELSFEFSFRPDYEDYFGYIVRIVDNDNLNVDLIYDRNPVNTKHFKIITGDKFSNISFDLAQDKLFNSWNRITIRFDLDKHLLTLHSGNQQLIAQNVNLKKSNCYKILFGANSFKEFKTTDVPPMKIRDIALKQDGKQLYNWELNESKGNVAHETVKQKDAVVTNPLWIKKMHHDWQLLKTFTSDGYASISFDPENEIIYTSGNDSLTSYSIADNRLNAYKYSSGNQFLIRGNQSIFNPVTKTLLNINIDQKQVAKFNFKDKTWDQKLSDEIPETNYWQYNKFYSESDTSLYIIGGYGHFLYKNNIQRYHLPSKRWQQIKIDSNSYIPRYLAALGVSGKGAYILGGYGSVTGQQMLNPKNLYDLLYYDVQKKAIKKIYELNINTEDFVFANSMVINEDSQSYYALIFPKHKYESSLQLIKGSLKKPSFELLGNEIPYLFHDINSFADLYFCKKSKKLIAVTLFHNAKDKTEIKIYALNSPPLKSEVLPFAKSSTFNNVYLALAIFFIGLCLFAFWFYRKKKKPSKPETLRNITVIDIEAGFNGHIKAIENSIPVAKPVELKNAVFLFGDLQLFDASGNDITKYFTPLIKELFLAILLYTIKGRGISSEKLTEILWFDKSVESARNNRSVNIAKLKTILEKVEGCNVSKETGYWKIDLNDHKIWTDYIHYLRIVNDKNVDAEKILQLAQITERGRFLSNAEYEWLDPFKSKISNEVVDTYIKYAETIEFHDNSELLIKIADYIFYFDGVNEEAMIIKCKALSYLGKHSLAKATYDNFRKEYIAIYGEDYRMDFQAVLE